MGRFALSLEAYHFWFPPAVDFEINYAPLEESAAFLDARDLIGRPRDEALGMVVVMSEEESAAYGGGHFYL